MKENEIRQKIESFPVWHYQFNLKGHLTPIRNEEKINRHLQRKKYFFDPAVKLLGGSLVGSRILDLGCNAGFWALHAIENGCDFVLGIDGRQMHIDQANFVFDVNQVDKNRYIFIKEDVFEVNFKEFGSFDIVFFLGLMYHINKPVTIMEKISEINSDILIIDTSVIKEEGSYLKIIRESVDDPRNAFASELVFRPSKQAIFDIVQQFGYKVVMLKPQFSDYTGAEGYKQGIRRAFVCAKKTDLVGLPASIESLDLG
jgi:2-polyprenyl-3-methyl-5-hydroxy-6-metoxy-1,4-benzoquinol methylase